MKFEIKWTGHEGSDCTDSFEVNFTEGLTVEQLVNHILTNRKDDHGLICLSERYNQILANKIVSDKFLVDYRLGQVISKDAVLYNAIKDLAIRKIDGSGGYTRMDYILYFNFGEDEKKVSDILKQGGNI